mgnify:CR=1 FL=1
MNDRPNDTPDTDHAPTRLDPTAADRAAEFAGSEMFTRLFQEGMGLVEEAAAYLDGAGRDDAKRLGRSGALAYAAESMALTTRLMQAASWLLTQRAVAEAEMSPHDACQEKYRLPAAKEPEAMWPAGDDPCPPRLADLAARSRNLYDRLARLDETLFRRGQAAADDAAADHPLEAQWSALESAFARR